GAGLAFPAQLVDALARPDQLAADFGESGLDEFAYRMHFAGGEHVVVGLRLLQHEPHALDVIPGVAPVALRVEIAEIEAILESEFDCGDGAGDLAGDE